MDRVANRFALLCVVGQSLAALKRPAQVSVVCNDARALTAMKQAAHRSELGGPHAAEYAGYAAAEAHEIDTASHAGTLWANSARLLTKRAGAGWNG